MISRLRKLALCAVFDQRGQTLVFISLLLPLLVGIAGLTVDLGGAYISYRELQSSTDAAALAGSYGLSSPTATTAAVTTAAQQYSSLSVGYNANGNLSNVTFNITFKCLTTLANEGIPCTSSTTGYNAVQVKQTATSPTIFIRILRSFGLKTSATIGLVTTATAAMKGATNAQYNVALVVDTTASMGSQDTDASCNNTRIYCALSGAQSLLQLLSPCTVSSTTSNCTPFDQVSLFTFPNVTASTASKDYTCPTSNPTITPYTTPIPGASWSAPTGSTGTYQITNYLSDYSSTNKPGGILSTSSGLSIASGGSGKSGCSGMQTPGGDGTYYAGAIYAALSSLAAEAAANPGSKNALIILSDGDASSTKITANNGLKLTATGIYPSLIDQCQQAVTAAKSAPSDTTVYTIAYGASSSGCSTDVPAISPCQAMEDMATAPGDFFSDATASQNVGQCISSSNPSLSLTGIFKQLTTHFTKGRLIPDNTT